MPAQQASAEHVPLRSPQPVRSGTQQRSRTKKPANAGLLAGCSDRTVANALATLHCVLRFARRHGWIVDDPIAKLEFDERRRPAPRRQRVVGPR
jgi:hypothetical protein